MYIYIKKKTILKMNAFICYITCIILLFAILSNYCYIIFICILITLTTYLMYQTYFWVD